MATISKLKPGQVVYDKHKYKMGNTTMTRWGVWCVFIKEVDIANNKVFASWNGNPPKWFYSRTISKWRVKEPKRED